VENSIEALRGEEARLYDALQLVRARRRELDAVTREIDSTTIAGSLSGIASISEALAELDEILERRGINTQELLYKYGASNYPPIAQITLGFAAGACSILLLNAILNKKNM
jgi:hypothetical protein